MTRKKSKTKFKDDVDRWSTWGHVIADIECWVVKDIENDEAVTKLEALEMFAEYLNEIIFENESWEYSEVL